MNISKKKVTYIAFVILCTFAIINFSVLIYRLYGLFYSVLITIVVITIFLIAVLTRKKLNTCPWYKEMTDKQYQLFYETYSSYQKDVLKEKKSYRAFLNEYQNSHSFISIPTDSYGNVLVDELNKKNLHINCMLDILQHRKDLIDKYFQKDSFGYSDYLSLVGDYSATALPFEDDISRRNYRLEDEFVERKVKEFVLNCYEGNGVMSLGDRNFGYYIKHRHPEMSTARQYTDAWNKYIGKHEPRDKCKYISDPSYWKNQTEIPATLESIERIELFYLSLLQEDSLIINTIRKDIIKLEKC